MDALSKALWIGCGGFLGANARYWIGGALQNRMGASFPWQTVLVNVSGSLIIGFFMGLSNELNWSPHWRLFIAIGLLGGYTTFSSFAYEAINMIGERQYGWALIYVQGTALVTVFAAWVGLVLSRIILGGRA